MSEFLFKLNGVPEDEANDIRQILEAHDIGFYETSAGKWGISSAAIWLIDKEQLQQASLLIHHYQLQRQTRIKADYEHMQRQGETETFMARIWRYPVQFVIYLALILAILYISIKPFFFFGK